MTSGFIERQEQGDEITKTEKIISWDDNIHSPAILTRKTGEIFQINAVFTELTGFRLSEISGIPVSTYLKQVNDELSATQSVNSPLLIYLVHKNRKPDLLCHFTRESINPEGTEEFDLIQLYPLTGQSYEMNGNQKDTEIPDDRLVNSNSLNSILTHKDTLAKIIPDLLILIDKKANVLEVNQNQNFAIPHLSRLLRNKNLFRLFPEKSQIIVKILDEVSIARESEIQIEIIGSGKKKRFLKYKLVSVDNNQLMAVIHDITELALTEEALLLSNERLNQIQQISGIGSWDVTFNEEPKILTWNFFELLGVEYPENHVNIDHIRHYNLVHPDDVKRCRKSIEEAIEQKADTYSIDYRILDRGKNIRHLHSEAQLKFNNSGRIWRWTGTLQDITTQKKAERMKSAAFQISQLIHSQHNLSHLMEAIHQIIASLMPAPNLLIALRSESDGKITFPYCIDPAGVPDAESAVKGLIGFALGTGEPLLVSAAAIDLMISEKIIRKPLAVPESWLGIPLKAHDRVLGVITLQSYTPDITYGEDEKDIL
ncbi:MAG: PAS domain-containing protein, partial [Lentimicrobium sp.]|nr:PAS domain-containing protein [Lentimicrobium sp.]